LIEQIQENADYLNGIQNGEEWNRSFIIAKLNNEVKSCTDVDI
jgi:hypothetical protein